MDINWVAVAEMRTNRVALVERGTNRVALAEMEIKAAAVCTQPNSGWQDSRCHFSGPERCVQLVISFLLNLFF